jgi:hypothetical protein
MINHNHEVTFEMTASSLLPPDTSMKALMPLIPNELVPDNVASPAALTACFEGHGARSRGAQAVTLLSVQSSHAAPT